MLILSDIIPFCAATRRNRNRVADDCAAVALERIEPDGSPTRPFPLHQVSTGTLPTAPSASNGILPTAPSASNGILPTAPSTSNGIFAKPPPALDAYHRYLFSLGAFHPATLEARAAGITERCRLQQSLNGIPVKQARVLHS